MMDNTAETPAHAPNEHRARRGGVAVIVTVLGVAAGTGYTLVPRETPEPASAPAMSVEGGAVHLDANAPQWRYLELAQANRSKPLPPVPAPGRVAVDEARAAPIYAPLAGRVERVSVQLGDTVKPGDRLLAIRSSWLPELGREVESARAALGVKTAMLERTRDLVKLRAVAEKDLLLAEQERHEVELTLKAAEGKWRSLRLGALDDSGLYWVTATKRGTVVERKALIGMEVGPDRSEPLLAIAELDQVIVVADVLERDAEGLGLGQKAQIVDVSLGNAPVEGTIEYIAQVVDSVRHTVAIRVRAGNADRMLRPNAFAQVTFTAQGEPRVVVPTEAVVTDDQKSVVFVSAVGPKGTTRLERRPVQVGRARDGLTEIRSGLAPGETFVSKGALLLLNALDVTG